MNRIVICLGVLFFLLMAFFEVDAREILVPEEFTSLQLAIDALKDGDKIVISKKFNRPCNKLVIIKNKQGVGIVSKRPLVFTNKIGPGIRFENSDGYLENIHFLENEIGIEAIKSNISVKRCKFKKNKIGILLGESVANVEEKNLFEINFQAAILLNDFESVVKLNKGITKFRDNYSDIFVSDNEDENYKTGARIIIGK